MDSQSSHTPASYLPTKKSQLASQARITKINELYEKSKKEHRDSVVSNNSTSVVSNTVNSDNCVPIHGLKRKPHSAYQIDDVTATAKQETHGSNLFRFKLPAHSSTLSPFFDGPAHNDRNETVMKDETAEHTEHAEHAEDHDNYEDELKFTPRLKSRRSLIISSTLGDTERSPKEERPERLRHTSHEFVRRNRKLSLRKTLGDPLPLPYIKKEDESSLNENDTVLTDEIMNQKRRLIESKWRNLISPGKSMLENKFKDNKNSINHNNATFSISQSDLSMSSPTPTSGINNVDVEIVNRIKEEIFTNRAKLDEIIKLLNHEYENNITRPILNEYYFWLFCIIILIFFNVYVYYY